ncbi:ribulose-phosphate 3-epimerase [Candidatus Fermentibacteria bacterium]|nr:ribulose-phosphate 3-epimerase [Candidatus Fermentibacteria bacterium]
MSRELSATSGVRRIEIHPSLLAADFAHLADEIRDVEPFVDGLHLDVMDGVFVPNISFGPVVVEAVRRATRLPLHCHLMIAEPSQYISAFRDAGADTILVHIETLTDPVETIEDIKASGARVGITLNPETPTHRVQPWLPAVDELLIMSVHPGFGGQSFQPESLKRIRWAVHQRDVHGLALCISVDGGIGPANARQVAQAGADILVAGTSVFRAPDRRAAVDAMRGAHPFTVSPP